MRWLAVLMWLGAVLPAGAQSGGSGVFTGAPSGEPRTAQPATLGFDYDAAFLSELPLADSLYSLFEHVQPSLITDRFTGGGLNFGQGTRVGGFQASWTQTRYLIDDVDLSDPTGSGSPLLFPDLGPWQSVRVATGLLGSDVNATGLAVTLRPHSGFGAAGRRWRHAGTAAASSRQQALWTGTRPEPIARAGRSRAAWMSSGRVTDRVAAMIAGSLTQTAQYDRSQTTDSAAWIGSALASLEFRAAGGGQLHTLAWVQKSEMPFDYRLAYASPEATSSEASVHVQSTWTASPGRWPWRAFGAYSHRSKTPQDVGRTGVVERLLDGPVSSIGAPSRGTVRQTSIGARTLADRAWGRAIHRLSGGVDLAAAHHRTPPSGVSWLGELTDGVPSRLWVFTNPSAESVRQSVTVSVHVADAVQLASRLRVSGGLRFESTSGSADGAAGGIGWRSLLPRARLDWQLREAGATTFFLGYSRTAYRLALDLLAFGDPAAPTADLRRLTGLAPQSALDQPVIARVGPGTGGQEDFVRIEPDLTRPTSDELAFGFEIRPGRRARYQIALVGRRETGFIGLTNLGAPPAAYSQVSVADPGANTGKPDDDRMVPVYSRLPSTFGRDRYVLTNSGDDPSLSGSLELSGQWIADRLTVFGGATASIAHGPASNLGYGPLENDQSAIPDAYVTPNALTYNRGRLFNDRAFTVKLSGVYRLPWDVRFGAIARYQDGQPFSRVLVFPGLPQGTEAVRAFAAGDSRFRFVGTLDARLSKGIRIPGGSVAIVLDAYNVLNLTYDVEERAAQAPNDRTPIAIQPPRMFHVGLRVAF